MKENCGAVKNQKIIKVGILSVLWLCQLGHYGIYAQISPVVFEPTELDTLRYCDEVQEELSFESQEYVLMMFKMPRDGTIKGLNVPIANWGDGESTNVHLSLWKLTYPYDSEGNIYSQLHVDSIGWCGYKWDGLDNSIPVWENTGNTVYFGDSDDEIGPCENTLPVPNAQELIYQKVWNFDFAQPWLNPDDNPAGKDNWFITKQWGDEPVFSKGEWVGLLAQNSTINGTGVVFFNSCNRGNGIYDSWVLAQFFSRCNGPSGEGGWHILSSVLNWELSIEYDDSLSTISNSEIPSEFKLNQPHPNPFNPQATIEFSIPQGGIVSLTVYDVLGRQVVTILNKYTDAGHHKLHWNASDIPSGIYFIRMLHRSPSGTGGDFSQVRKVMVVR